jgi:hypothetical protein
LAVDSIDARGQWGLIQKIAWGRKAFEWESDSERKVGYQRACIRIDKTIKNR